MSPILDWMMIIISTFITYKTYKKFVFNKHCSVAYYVILIVYIFCCLPIVLNYLIGIPTYSVVYWYQSFIPAMNNSSVAAIYDIYILTAVYLLYRYGRKANKRLARKENQINYKLRSENENPVIYVLGVISPLLYAILSGNISKLIVYNSMTGRGIVGQDNLILNSLILVSLYFVCILVFSGEVTKKKLLILLPLSIMIAWMQGKRFIIAVMGIFYLFFLTKSQMGEKGRKRLFLLLPILGVALIAFSAFYLAIIKPLSNMAFYSVYDMLRVDYGRDDVIKFVIYEEFFKKNHILEYTGQSFFSTLFIFIPRFIWPNKPYSHYQYLTSAILDVAINKLPAGTTPSWYEMCLSNFGYLGFVIGVFGLPLLCRFADRMKQIKSKSLVFMLILVLLTQNTDVYIVYTFFIFVYYFMQNVKYPKIRM